MFGGSCRQHSGFGAGSTGRPAPSMTSCGASSRDPEPDRANRRGGGPSPVVGQLLVSYQAAQSSRLSMMSWAQSGVRALAQLAAA